MSENDQQPQNRPSRRSVGTQRRAVGQVRQRTSSEGHARSSYGQRSARTSGAARSTAGYERRTQTGERPEPRPLTAQRRATPQQTAGGGILSSIKETVEAGRESLSERVAQQRERSAQNGTGESLPQRVMGMLPESDWVRRGILIVAALLVIILLFNLVSCIANGISGSSSAASSNAGAAATTSSEAAQTSSDASALTTVAAGVDSPWTDDGKFSTGDSTLDVYIKNLCDQYSKEGGTFDSNAYDTYIYVSRTDYVERANNQSPWGENWDVEYAKQYFDEGNSGNCFNYAAVIEYVLKYFGYSDAEAEPCVVLQQSGDAGDHGLVFVTNKVDGKASMIDAALSANGWMLGADEYQFDVRNINQNATVKGNTDLIDDEPMQIPPGELTEPTADAADAAAAAGAAGAAAVATADAAADGTEDTANVTVDGETTDVTATDEEEEPVYIEETEEVYYDDTAEEEEYTEDEEVATEETEETEEEV